MNYDVQTADGVSYQRNHAHLNKTVEKPAAAAAHLNDGDDDDVPTADTHEPQHNAAAEMNYVTLHQAVLLLKRLLQCGRNVKLQMRNQD